MENLNNTHRMYLQVHVVASPREVAVSLHLKKHVTFPFVYSCAVTHMFKEVMTEWFS
jgi:hypothetical protein